MLAAAAAALLIAAGPAMAEEPEACLRAYGSVDAALQGGASRGGDVAGLERVGLDLAKTVGCDADRRTQARRRVARALAALITHGEGSEAEKRARLGVALRIAPVWEALAGLADLDFAARNYEAAEAGYNRALNDMGRRYPGDPEVPKETYDFLYRRASEVGMLSPTLPEAQRDGSPGGVDAVLVPGSGRDIVARPRLMPVTYEYARAVMTQEGETFAAAWLDSLKGASIPALVLIGHTDPQGSASANEALSLRRAQALGAFLKQRGFGGAITALGWGQRCPIQFTSDHYTDDERNAILRRVEVVRGGALPPDFHCSGTPVR